MNKTNTDCSVEMLNEIYQAASMGVDGSELLINKTEDCDFSDILHEYWNRYNDIKKEAASLLSQKGEVPKGALQWRKSRFVDGSPNEHIKRQNFITYGRDADSGLYDGNH